MLLGTGVAAVAHWAVSIGADVGVSAGNLALSAVPGSPLASYAFVCDADSCDPATVTDSRTFTNDGSIPTSVYVKWGPAGAASCEVFDVIVADGTTTLWDASDGTLCDLLALPDGLQVAPQVDPGDSVTVSFTVDPDPTRTWTSPLTLNLTTQTVWGQWTGTLTPTTFGWWVEGSEVPFTIQMTYTSIRSCSNAEWSLTLDKSTWAFSFTNLSARNLYLWVIADSPTMTPPYPWNFWATGICRPTWVNVGQSCSSTVANYVGPYVRVRWDWDSDPATYFQQWCDFSP